MEPTDTKVEEFIDGITHPIRQRDARRLVDLLRETTGEEPRMWGSIVGFGQYDYRYESGREGTAPAAGFAPRKSASTIYLSDGVTAHTELLARLGEHTTGTGCLYVKDLDRVDLEVLKQIVSDSFQSLSEGIYPNRARDGRPSE